MLIDLEGWLQSVQLPATITQSDLDQIIFNRLNERYYPAFQMAQLLLQGLTVQLLAGGQRAIAFVFDMDRLFEQFVASFLQTYKNRILPHDWQDLPIEQYGGSIKKYLIQSPQPSEKPMFPLEPDILVGFPGRPKLIIDTKNKVLPLRNSHRAIAESDAFQMLAYSTQYQCRDVLLLYPHTLGAEGFSSRMLKIDQSSIRLFIATLNLHQPLNRTIPLIQEFHNIFASVIKQTSFPSEAAWPA